MKLIKEYHKNDMDKGGNPYIYHLLNVSNGCNFYQGGVIPHPQPKVGWGCKPNIGLIQI